MSEDTPTYRTIAVERGDPRRYNAVGKYVDQLHAYGATRVDLAKPAAMHMIEHLLPRLVRESRDELRPKTLEFIHLSTWQRPDGASARLHGAIVRRADGAVLLYVKNSSLDAVHDEPRRMLYEAFRISPDDQQRIKYVDWPTPRDYSVIIDLNP